MTRLASPKIVFNRGENTDDFRERMRKIYNNLHRTFNAKFATCNFFRQPGEDGTFNAKSLSNKIHRASVHMGYYFADPVIINFNKALSLEERKTLLTELRYTDLGRVYWVEVNEDDTYTVDLMINANTDFNVHNNIHIEETNDDSPRTWFKTAT